jgi:inner membrane transporter RhtA
MGSKVEVPAWVMAVSAMVSIQVGAALSLPLASEIGAGGTSWLRLSFGGLIFYMIGRQSLRAISKSDWPNLVGLGLSIAIMSVAFLESIARIPLGTAVAIEFLGPLSVAAYFSKSGKAKIWPIVALTGVILMTEPWKGEVNLAGIAFAGIAALAWAAFIIFTQRVGDNFKGVKGLAISIPIAAIATGVVGVNEVLPRLTPDLILMGAGLALLIPVIPYTLEMMALRRMNRSAFGTLMSVEPAIALTIGALLLLQIPTLLQTSGISLVLLAGYFSQRDSGR